MNATTMVVAGLFGLVTVGARQETDGVSIDSPGLPASRLDGEGRLVEDWGALEVRLQGDVLSPREAFEVSAVRIEETVPAARATWRRGAVDVELTAWRAPIWPGGVDVLEVHLQERAGQSLRGSLALTLPGGARLAERSITLDGRRILTLPASASIAQELRAWGHADEATSLPGWAKPEPGFDPAFASIRAGMGGVTIRYRFDVEPGSESDVVLGFCESYWSEPGNRLMSCKVEGAPLEQVDPLARWGRHRPGGVLFEGRDADGDGHLEVLVLPAPGTPDRNPILNALWVFPPGHELDPAEVARGGLNALARRRVDVGGECDQSVYPPGELEFPVSLEPGGRQELTFLVACPGGAAPPPEDSAWTQRDLRRAAREVRDAWQTE